MSFKQKTDTRFFNCNDGFKKYVFVGLIKQ